MRKPCLNRLIGVALVHRLPQEIAMNHPMHTQPPRQTTLPLGSGAHWEQLPREVRERCRALVAQLLASLMQRQLAGGDDDER